MVILYISGHGFGHAARTLEVIRALRRRAPGLPVVVRTAVPTWFFQGAPPEAFDIVHANTDVGLAQVDSLTIDEHETVRRAVHFYDSFDERVTTEASWLTAMGARVVVSDVPPLASAAAARAQVPSIVVANFTWDWIYRGLDRFDDRAPGVLTTIEDAYASTTCALRLPLHGGFAPMRSVVRDIPFIARRSRRGREDARRALGLASDRPIVLGSFGGHGVRMPYAKALADGRLLLLLTDFEVETSGDVLPESAHVRCLSQQELTARDLRYEDLVAAADVVVSKPGYGIVSECIANRTALLYTSRGRMIEYDVFVEEMPRFLRCRYIPQQELLAGNWADAVADVLGQAEPRTTAIVNGADVAAESILTAG